MLLESSLLSSLHILLTNIQSCLTSWKVSLLAEKHVYKLYNVIFNLSVMVVIN